MPQPLPLSFHRLIFSLLTRFAVVIALLGQTGCLREGLPSVLAMPFDAVGTLAKGEVPAIGKIFRVAVTRVADGDTFEFRHDGITYRARLSGIDAPERTQPYADFSRKALKTLIEGKDVHIDILKVDVYKRFVCKVWSLAGDEPRDAALQMLDQGLGWHFKRYLRDQSPDDRLEYARVEERARAQARGLWQDEAPLAPWLFREQQKAATSKRLLPVE